MTDKVAVARDSNQVQGRRSPPPRRTSAGAGSGAAAAPKETLGGRRARLWVPGPPRRLPAEPLTTTVRLPLRAGVKRPLGAAGVRLRHIPRPGADERPPRTERAGASWGAARTCGGAGRGSGQRDYESPALPARTQTWILPAWKARARAQRGPGRTHLSPVSSSSAAMAAVLRKRRAVPRSRLTGRLGRLGRRRP